MNLSLFLYLSSFYPYFAVLSGAARAHGRSTGALAAILSLTPYGNTGSNCQNGTIIDPSLYLSIDWLTFTLPIKSIDDVMAVAGEISHLFQDVVTIDEDKGFFCGKYYASSGRSARGCLMTWNLPAEVGLGDMRVSIPAKALSECRQDEIWAYIRSLVTMQAKFTRIDIALDDYSKAISPENILEAYQAGNYARFRSFRPIVNYKNGDLDGWTLYLGSRGSESCVRYYDKEAESKGALECYRLEAEFRDAKASEVCDKLACIPTDNLHEMAPRLLSGCLMGCVDFPDRGGVRRRLDRCSQLPWWKSFCDRVGESLRVVVRRTVSTLQDGKNWSMRSAFPLIAAVLDYFYLGDQPNYANNWLNYALDEGRKNRSPQLQARLDAAILQRDRLDLYNEMDAGKILEFIV